MNRRLLLQSFRHSEVTFMGILGRGEGGCLQDRIVCLTREGVDDGTALALSCVLVHIAGLRGLDQV